MTDLDVLLAVAGLTVTVLVVAGMILITPRGTVDAFDDVTDPQGAELSRAAAIDPAHTAARRRRVGPVREPGEQEEPGDEGRCSPSRRKSPASSVDGIRPADLVTEEQ